MVVVMTDILMVFIVMVVTRPVFDRTGTEEKDRGDQRACHPEM
jgi:hypothetical protein